MLPSNSQLKCVIRLLPFFAVLLRLYRGREQTRISPGKPALRRLLPSKVRRKSISSLTERLLYRGGLKGILQLGPKFYLLIPLRSLAQQFFRTPEPMQHQTPSQPITSFDLPESDRNRNPYFALVETMRRTYRDRQSINFCLGNEAQASSGRV